MAYERLAPTSTMIESMSYDDESKTLVVVLKNGREYTTPGFDPEMWADFKAAESPGRFYRTMVMGLDH